MSTNANAPVETRHKDEAAKDAGYDNWSEVETFTIMDGRIRSSTNAHAQSLANLEAANNRLAEIKALIGPIVPSRFSDDDASRLSRAHNLASGHTPSPCPSCNGLNISCPEGCERDPLTGELIPWACPGCAAKDEAMAEMKATITEAMDLGVGEEAWDVLKPYRTPPADPLTKTVREIVEGFWQNGTPSRDDLIRHVSAELKSRLPLGGCEVSDESHSEFRDNLERQFQAHLDKQKATDMTTTDPKLIEPVAWMYEDENGSVVVYRNRVPLPGFVIETPLYTAAAINEAVQKERAGILRWIARNGDRVASVSTACMEGDNLAVTLCSYFDNPDQETDDETGWTKDAVDGCNEVIAAIVKFFADAIEAGEWKQ